MAPEHGASGILQQIREGGDRLVQKYHPRRIGIGFGGPVNQQTGHAVKSHQIRGWDEFPLGDWSQENLKTPAIIGNDCDCAALAEAVYGAGRTAGATRAAGMARRRNDMVGIDRPVLRNAVATESHGYHNITKEEEKRSKKERENVLRLRVSAL